MKEFDDQNRAFLHLLVEVSPLEMKSALTRDIINEHLAIYFRYIDTDYKDLKSLLGIEPLKVTIIPTGTIKRFTELFGRRPRKINPSHFDMIELLKLSHNGTTGV